MKILQILENIIIIKIVKIQEHSRVLLLVQNIDIYNKNSDLHNKNSGSHSLKKLLVYYFVY